MSTTPWGPAERLRERRLRPGPSNDRERVTENQRTRLLAAIVSVAAEKGYAATTVADLVEVAGVSRSSFYSLFENKHDCFVAALDTIATLAGPSVLDVYDRTSGPWDRKLGAVLDALGELVAAQPAVARVAWVEVYAAGPEAIAHIERIDARVERIVQHALSNAPEHAEAPRDAVRAVIGGLRKIVHMRVREGGASDLPASMPELLDWMRSYHAPAQRLHRPSDPPPGLVPESAVVVDSRERMLDAVTDIVAEKGYPPMTITGVARRAGVSLSTFYKHFSSKEEAFVEAIYRARRRSLEVAAPAFAAADDWPHAVAGGIHALVALYALDPALARLGGVAVYEGSDAALESRDAGLVASQAFLEEGYSLYPDTPPIAAEAVGATVYALLSDHVRQQGPERLYELAPLAVFLVLAPFMGAEAAVAVANEPVRVTTPGIPPDALWSGGQSGGTA